MADYIALAEGNRIAALYRESGAFAPVPVRYDDEGKPNKWQRHPSIPEDAIKVPADVADLIEPAPCGYIWAGGEVAFWLPPVTIIFEEQKAMAIAGIVAEADRIGDEFKAGYPVAEQQTWSDQAREARAVVAGDLAPSEARLLMKIAGSYQAVTGLAERVVANADWYEDVAAQIILTRKEAEAAIAASMTSAELDETIAALRAAAAARRDAAMAVRPD